MLTFETGCGATCASRRNPPVLSVATSPLAARPMLPATRSAGELMAQIEELSAEVSRLKARAEDAEEEVRTLRLGGRPGRGAGFLWGLGGMAVGAALFGRR